ncbi:hypothetical protein A3B21_01475 [Candidatus Uhrbacteria bacterium RIFCSPLOWO2_01_FULL_47_24]|uniref:EF-hand domain-containing protein n=1 Tax=Candidatus Uhrbacteria bacterium RIFCSPLOWO2_01_FULL_47_24 TaxID=1802401 RepID=A0A1F7UNX4_9BACT|nr:MAG: hypothetical protein A3D58_02850 [Candidatus Uhrbacteria bacterium RIFCSPHIGHO2_02_FULL_46_47]OGL76718.1 MAG: hypothetical protein A3F52_00475 [Candidatus Uhrbacteria bacterium RIFCSPHIGHO2_12_FULL_47_11]OGL79945.1 MAG: hypothetical protein A3B21_01475 [Candidatus Uhrbacteria bacterium RIFCSPLOWO2_01_FULL_47_24]OGL84201.1 MAG: hypothetical protein A3J03_02070 [Candidatus Uhrbacteria bacterium RIFCSPLOWO2_02_FULL_46_25]
MIRLIIAFAALFVGLTSSVSAYLWQPPQKAYYDMLRATQTQDFLNTHIQGSFQGAMLKSDIVTGKQTPPFFRISYPPLKLINNQWIDLSNDEKSEEVTVADSALRAITLTKRLSSAKEQGARFNRYAFVIKDSKLLTILPLLGEGSGEIWFYRKSKLPYKAMFQSNRLGVKGAFFEISFSFHNIFSEGAPRFVRKGADVSAQLTDVQEKRRKEPKEFVALGASYGEDPLFYNDFDHDNLSDALEIFYGTDSENPDTDNDTFIDGDEIEKGYNPLGAGTINQ